MSTLIATIVVVPDRPRGEVQARTTFRNLESLPRIQELCERFCVKPTYLLTYPVLLQGRSEWLQRTYEAGRCDLGVSFASWLTPPFQTNENRLSLVAANQLGPSATAKKVANLTHTFQTVVGFSPSAHRCLEFGLTGSILQALEVNGVRVDSSICPGLVRSAAGQVDWEGAPVAPYHPDRQQPSLRGVSPVLEVPLSIGYELPWPMSVMQHAPTWIGPGAMTSIAALTRRVTGRAQVLEVGVQTLATMSHIIDQQLQQELPTVMLHGRSHTFHSGCSLETQSVADAENAFMNLDGVLRYAVDRHQLASSGLPDFAQRYLMPV